MDKKIIAAIVGVVALVVIVLGCCGAALFLIMNSGEDAKYTFDKPGAKNEDVDLDGITWKVTAAEDLGDVVKTDKKYGSDCEADSGARFVKVTFTMTNNSKESTSIASLKLFDSNKNEYSTEFMFSCLEDYKSVAFENVGPSLAKSSSVYYIVPSSATGLKLEVSNNELFGEEVGYIDLGL